MSSLPYKRYLVLLLPIMLAGCGVVSGAASVVGSAAGAVVDTASTVAGTAADVVTKPVR